MDAEAVLRDGRTVAEAYLAERWADIRSRFDATMATKLSEVELAGGWKAMQRSYGRRVTIGESLIARVADNQVVDTDIKFHRGPLGKTATIRVSYNERGEIAGLFVTTRRLT